MERHLFSPAAAEEEDKSHEYVSMFLFVHWDQCAQVYSYTIRA